MTKAAHRSRPTLRVAAVTAAAILFAPLLYPLVTGRVFTRDDLAALHLPFRYLYSQALHDGRFLLWTPAYHAGFFLHGAGEAGMAHPLHLLLYRLLPLGAAFNLEIISSYGFLFAGMYLLWRALELPVEAALVGAMLSAFSGFTVYNLMHVNHIATLAHAPWLLLACHGVLTSGRRARWCALAALVTGSQILAGNPQYMWLTLIAAVCFCAWQWRRDTGAAPLMLLGAAAILGVMIGAVQLLPSLEFFGDSARAVWSPEQALSFSLSPWNVIQLWAPFFFQHRVYAPGEDLLPHEFIVYNGALCTVALAWIAVRWRDLQHRALAKALLIFAAIAAVLALGRYGGVYPLIAQLPIMSGFRASSRHIVLVQCAMAGLAAITVADWITITRNHVHIEPRRLWPVFLVIALAIGTVLVGAWLSRTSPQFSTPMRSIPFALSVVIVAVLAALVPRGGWFAISTIVIVSAVDLSAWGYSYAYSYGPLRSIDELQREAQVPPQAERGDMIPLVAGGRDYLAILRGLRLINGYTGLYPRTTTDWGRPDVERRAGLQWRGDGDHWQRVEDALPRARMESDGGDTGQARVITEAPGYFEVDTSAPSAQRLIFTERYHRAWRAQVDGTAVMPMAVYGDFLGVPLPEGAHHVVVEFAPASFRRGWQISLFGLLLTAVATSVAAGPTRRGPGTTTP